MAKRTNKTDHVLNLLSSGKKTSGSEPEKEETNAPPVDLDPKKEPPQEAEPERGPEPETEPAPAVKAASEVTNVSVVHMSDNEENPIAESVKESLEEDWDSFVKQKEEQTLEEPQSDAEEEAAPEPAETEAAASQETEPAQGEQTEEKGAEDEAEPDYATVNVMERLVRDKAVEYMTQFQNCTCPRCVEDTVALTLTCLPAKYVVINKAAVSPLLNFYEKKYAGQIIVELTKACMVVSESPHH